MTPFALRMRVVRAVHPSPSSSPPAVVPFAHMCAVCRHVAVVLSFVPSLSSRPTEAVAAAECVARPDVLELEDLSSEVDSALACLPPPVMDCLWMDANPADPRASLSTIVELVRMLGFDPLLHMQVRQCLLPDRCCLSVCWCSSSRCCDAAVLPHTYCCLQTLYPLHGLGIPRYISRTATCTHTPTNTQAWGKQTAA